MLEERAVFGRRDPDDVLGANLDFYHGVVVGNDDAVRQFLGSGGAHPAQRSEAEGDKQERGEQLFHGIEGRGKE